MRGRVRQKAVPIVPALASNGFVLIAAVVAGSLELVKAMVLQFGRAFDFFRDSSARARAFDAWVRDGVILSGIGGIVLWIAAIGALFIGLVPLDRTRMALVLQTVVLGLCAAGAALDAVFYLRAGHRTRTWWWLVDVVPVAVALTLAAAAVGRELNRRRRRPSPA